MKEEISARLTEKLINQCTPTLAGRLQPALALANHQLEYLCPAIAGMGSKGVFRHERVGYLTR